MKKKNVFEKLHCAIDGVFEGVLTQRSMQIELVVGALMVMAGWMADLSPLSWMLLSLSMAGVLAAELMNTAVEQLCDLHSKEYHPGIRVIKDVAAGGVFISAAACLAMAIFVLYPYAEPRSHDLLKWLREAGPWTSVVLIAVILGVHFLADPDRGPSLRWGFPSLHSLGSFALATSVFFVGDHLLLGFLALMGAALIAQSRVVAQVCRGWESLMGSLIGMGTALLFFQLWK